jgi:hypothetical protein
MPLHPEPKCNDWTAVRMAVSTDVVASDRLVATVGDHDDALLIAAAPDLLEALLDAQHALADCAAAGDKIAAEALISVRDAIAKATGGK